MKWTCEAPATIVDITPLQVSTRSMSPAGLRLGAFVKMRAVADQPMSGGVPRIVEVSCGAPVPQLRNMATLGGNLLQRTRCPYYRERESGALATSAIPAPVAPRLRESTATTPSSASIAVASRISR